MELRKALSHWDCNGNHRVFSHPGAAQGCPNPELMTQTSPLHPFCHSPVIPRPERKKPLTGKAAYYHFREGFLSLQTQATSQTAFEKPPGRVSPELHQDGFFSCSTMPEDRNWAKWKKQEFLGWFCSSHYSSHCLKSNSTSVFSAREEINCMGRTSSFWNTGNICQLSSR